MSNFINSKSIIVKAKYSELDLIREFLTQFSQDLNLNESLVFKILLAVEEAFVNIVKHSLKNDPFEEIRIEALIQGKKIEIILEDKGPSFDPRTTLSIDIEEIRKRVRKGGLGLILISHLMDEINYIPKNEVTPTNKLILTKILE